MTMLVLFLLAFCFTQVVWSKAQFDLEDAEQLFEIFIEEHNKHYANEEEKQARFEIFKENLGRAIQMNEESDHATFGITQFMDLSVEEFLRLHTGLRSQEHLIERSLFCKILTDADIPYVNAPASFDWRDHNAVTPPRNQGACQSCYAFSVTGNIEGQYAIKYKKLIELSKQQIVDCHRKGIGCRPGYLAAPLRWLIETGGIQAEADYPYRSVNGAQGMCKINNNKFTVKIADCYSYNITSEEKLKQLLYLNGPLSVGIIPHYFNYYKGGVLTDKMCNKNLPIAHAVLLVGYGYDEKGMPYWILKDSQGQTFGENGFFRIERGEGVNTCKMLTDFIVTSVIA